MSGAEGSSPANPLVDAGGDIGGSEDRGLVRTMKNSVRRMMGIDPQADVSPLPRLA